MHRQVDANKSLSSFGQYPYPTTENTENPENYTENPENTENTENYGKHGKPGKQYGKNFSRGYDSFWGQYA